MEILLEKVDEYILIVDYSGKIIFANGKFLKKFGYKKNELCNININEVIANEYLEIDKISAYKNGVNKLNNEMKAHAWIRCGKMYITGGNGAGYATVAKFSNE